MQTFIDDLIPNAINAIAIKKEIRENQNNENSKILGIYESYLSQFGPMANQLLIRNTLAVYYNKKASSKGDRKIVLQLIFDLLRNTITDFVAPNTTFEKWINSILKNTDIDEKLEEQLLDASVALKRAIRTFILTDKDLNE